VKPEASQEGLKIRRYRPEDLDAVVDLWHRSWTTALPGLRHPHPIEAWHRRFREEISQEQAVWVAELACPEERGGRLAGFLAMFEQRGYVDQLYVEPALQGRGIGTALLAQARAASPDGLSLHALQANVAARAFYERHGFTVGETGTNRINGQPNVEYRWTPAGEAPA
jgi:ribosomal protein S18 acetylase RimI-like enzyme